MPRPQLGGSVRRATYHSPAQGLPAASPGHEPAAPPSARRPSPSLSDVPAALRSPSMADMPPMRRSSPSIADAQPVRRPSPPVADVPPPLDLELLPLPAPAAPAPGPARAPTESVADVPDLVIPGLAPAPVARPVRGPTPAKGTPARGPTPAAGNPAAGKGAAPTRSSVPPKGAVKTPKPGPSPDAAASLSIGAGAVFDDDFGPSLSLEVDDAPRHRAGKSTRPSVPSAGGSSGLDVAVAPRAPMGSVPPAGVRAASLPSMGDTSDLDPYTVKRLAGFGAAPSTLWEAPLYALRVGWRLHDLRRQGQVMRAAEVTARHALDEALIEFLDQRADELRHDKTTASLFEALSDLQRRRDDWSHSLAEAEERTAASLAEIDRALQQCERAVVDERSARDGLADEAARLFEAARAGDKVAGQMLAAVRGQMASAEQEATAAIARRTELLRERRTVEEDHDLGTRELRQGLAEAEAPRRERMLEVGRAALESRLFAGRPGSERLAAAEQKLAQATLERRLHEAAIDSYDPLVVRRGAMVIGALVVLTIVGVVLGVMRMNRELSAPPPVVPLVR